MQYTILDWDSKTFGLKIAKIVQPSLSREELVDICRTLKSQDIQLAYWPAKAQCANWEISGAELKLVDTKLTYHIDFSKIDPSINSTRRNVDFEPTPYLNSVSRDAMIALAIQSGEKSRFAVDTKFPLSGFHQLYQTWIERSIDKQIAEETLVVVDDAMLCGLITLGNNQSMGEIGLLAVDQNRRGDGLGETLVSAAQNWFIERDYQSGIVVTQQANIAACRLYEKCGYGLDKTEYYYHIWL